MNAHRHTLQSCVFGDYITRGGNLSKHMWRKHNHFTIMTQGHARPHYEREHPQLSPWDLQALMARDYWQGRCRGLGKSGMWTLEHQLESERAWRLMAGTASSATVTETSGGSEVFGLIGGNIFETAAQSLLETADDAVGAEPTGMMTRSGWVRPLPGKSAAI